MEGWQQADVFPKNMDMLGASGKQGIMIRGHVVRSINML